MPLPLRIPLLVLLVGCLPLAARASAEEPLTMTAEEAAEYRRTLNLPEVRAIRAFLDRYHSKDRKRVLAEVRCPGLQGRPDAHTRGRFAVGAVEDGLLGGQWFLIMFKDPPHAMLQVWVKNREVAGVSNSRIPKDQQAHLVRTYGLVLADPAFTR